MNLVTFRGCFYKNVQRAATARAFLVLCTARVYCMLLAITSFQFSNATSITVSVVLLSNLRTRCDIIITKFCELKERNTIIGIAEKVTGN